MEKLITALRCSSMTGQDCVNCVSCEYKLLEELPGDCPSDHDVVINGKRYWISCDLDRIVNEAADRLEEIYYGHQTNECRKGV